MIIERVQYLYHDLKYNNVEKVILIYLVQEAVQKLIYFPAQNSISKLHSLYMILHQTDLDYKTHGQHYPGQYKLGHNDHQIKNTVQIQALDCIYLRPSNTIYEKNELFHNSTTKIITK